MAWKKTMQVFQTSGVPPSSGRIILPIIGCTRKSSVALVNSVSAKTRSMFRANEDTKEPPRETACSVESREQTLAAAGVKPGALFEVQTREGVREAVAAGFGVGVVFESEFGSDDRFRPIRVADADLAVGEYAVCLQQRRGLALVRAFFDIAEKLASS